ncbi:hypothetical protein U9M48_022102 [Paspalum notatum var. saurae]|uniref:Trichome birefringence-like N-terminal domain-containing protein n=1 Tax=Paspalum notatum var. saurae TaxID=547442 RepID=A0AAQ3TH19_PASNO
MKQPSSSQAVRRAASTTGLLVVLLLVVFTACNYSSLNTDRLIDVPVPPKGASHVTTTTACDVASGQWVPDDAAAPYYTNATCPFIDSRQDCMRYGKPALDSILRWRWQPRGCDLPRFDAAAFLRLVRHRSMAFVGDSVARNHMQSLMCLLAGAEQPEEAEPKDCVHCTRTYRYRAHNFTVTVFWAPFLVRWNLTRAGALQFMDPHNVFLDEPDPEWARRLDAYDYVVLNAAKWFTRPVVLHDRGRVLGCSDCADHGAAAAAAYVPPHRAVRAAFRTALRALRDDPGFHGRVVVRTVAPPHYENGKWYDGGNCLRTRPLRSDEAGLPETEAAFHAAQVEEFRAAASAAELGRFVLMDVSEMMQMRGDGHPGQYGHWPHEKVGFGIDCVHWCLPGPIDAWSELLLHLLTN